MQCMYCLSKRLSKHKISVIRVSSFFGENAEKAEKAVKAECGLCCNLFGVRLDGAPVRPVLPAS